MPSILIEEETTHNRRQPPFVDVLNAAKEGVKLDDIEYKPNPLSPSVSKVYDKIVKALSKSNSKKVASFILDAFQSKIGLMFMHAVDSNTPVNLSPHDMTKLIFTIVKDHPVECSTFKQEKFIAAFHQIVGESIVGLKPIPILDIKYIFLVNSELNKVTELLNSMPKVASVDNITDTDKLAIVITWFDSKTEDVRDVTIDLMLKSLQLSLVEPDIRIFIKWCVMYYIELYHNKIDVVSTEALDKIVSGLIVPDKVKCSGLYYDRGQHDIAGSTIRDYVKTIKWDKL